MHCQGIVLSNLKQWSLYLKNKVKALHHCVIQYSFAR